MIFELLVFDDLARAICNYNTAEDGFADMLRAIADVHVSSEQRRKLMMACFLPNLPAFQEGDIHVDNMTRSFIWKLEQFNLENFNPERFESIALGRKPGWPVRVSSS